MTRAEAITLRNQVEQAASLQTDELALDTAWMYPAWNATNAYSTGHRVRYNGNLYRCLQSHDAQMAWTPTDAPSIWAEILPGQEDTPIGPWVQPDSTNPYQRGDKVTWDGKNWVSTVDNNTWQPGTYGWEPDI